MNFDNDDTDPFQGNSNNGLRTWAESVQKQNQDLQKQLADVQAQMKTQSISSVFEDLGVPRGAASLYKGDADPEAIKSWVNDVKTAFGVVAQTPGDSTPPAPVAPILDQNQQLQFQQINQAGTDGRPSTGIEDAQRQVNQATSVQDLINTFQTFVR